MKTFTSLTFAAAMTLAATASASHVDLRVKVSNIEHSEGSIKIAVYDSAESMKAYKAAHIATVEAQNGEIEATFEQVASGNYGVMVYQDLDGNDKLGRNFMGIPNEPYGFSNNPRLMGPPRFADLAVAVSEDAPVINVKLN
ncbi:DUF2141 domain-containing protein [Aestuariibacter sp. AA17]|uniref:DUF2141 domain-containing protein n=1 Tax=Fluctibacter corallii TaxID=2984329 RepID=A0ABT3ACE7_9ALTE|nr:DUF2141 domain-containing protein [Aestuariibacter sp. AA17]MCV2886350.1 DUF2141 domain-containing protein [Aestuariibacter sp. AA17]